MPITISQILCRKNKTDLNILSVLTFLPSLLDGIIKCSIFQMQTLRHKEINNLTQVTEADVMKRDWNLTAQY